jgi:hypothetical protein
MVNNPHSVTGGTVAATPEPFTFTRKPDGVSFLRRAVQPPSFVYVENEDDIAVACASSQTAETVTINYRLLRFDGQIIEGQFAVSPASNRTVKNYSESLAEGFLLSVSARASVATTRGQTFLRVFLTSPAFGGNLPSYMLFADYVTTQMAPAHPNGRVLSPSESSGNLRIVTGSNPAAGADCQINVPTNARWRLQSFFCTLSAGAAVANRQPFIQIASGGFGVYTVPFNAVVTAGQFAQLTAAPASLNVPSVGQFLFAPLPNDFKLIPVGTISTLTTAIQIADQYANVQMQVEEWLDNV